MLAKSLQRHLAGELTEAERGYREILALNADCSDAWHYLGLLAHQAGDSHSAKRHILNAVRLNPRNSDAHNNLGVVFYKLGQFADAVDCHRRALELRPAYSEAENNLANALKVQGLFDEAIAHYRMALRLKPDNADALNNLGTALQETSKAADAIECFQRAIQLRPDYPEAYNNLGKALKDEGHFQEAANNYKAAVSLRPHFAEALANLGDALMSLGYLDEGLEFCQRALMLQPNLATAHNNLGTIENAQGHLDHASRSYHRALEINPNHARAHFNLGMLHLLRGDFATGWLEYEWRWRTGMLPNRQFSQPQWEGSPLIGKTLFLHAEQGLGDTLQFIRYVPVLRELGAKVIVGCPSPLLDLLRRCPFIDHLISENNECSGFDLHCPLLTVPRVLKTTLQSIPAEVPYLWADSLLIQEWRERLGDSAHMKIGVNWHGRAGHSQSHQRDIPITCFERLAELPGVTLFSLQKEGSRGINDDSAVSAINTESKIVTLEGLDVSNGAFMDTAAVMKNLDLVITSDTSIAHLAGALGVPVWVALPFVADWRWLLDRSDSPWYPTMRLFRQKSPGDWSAVFGELREALGERLRGGY